MPDDTKALKHRAGGTIACLASLAAAAVMLAAATNVALATEAAPDHAAEVEAFSRLMADVRTAAEVCSGVSPDWTLVNAEKKRLHVAESDYPVFQRQAHERSDALEQRFKSEHGPAAWCAEAVVRYGPQGSVTAGALRK